MHRATDVEAAGGGKLMDRGILSKLIVYASYLGTIDRDTVQGGGGIQQITPIDT